MLKSALICATTALAIVGCSHQRDASAQPRAAKGQVELLQGQDTLLDTYVPAAGSSPALQTGRDPNSDKAVAAQCGLTPAPTGVAALPALLVAALPVIAGWVIDYAIAQVSSAAQRRIAEYSAVTSGALQFGPPTSDGFYRSIAPPTMAWKCVRLTHMVDQGKDRDGKALPRALAVEAIVKVEVAPAQDSLLITPLRLYFDRAVARTGSSKDSTFGVSVGLTFDALWQVADTGEGKAARVWNATALSQKIDGINWADDSAATTRQRFYYYNVGARGAGDKSDADNKPVPVPLVPWSLNRKPPFGNGTLTMTFAEVGDPPAVLEFVAGTLKDHGKDIGDFLKDAAKKAMPADASK